jgi:glutathione S-transferase
MVSSLTLSVNRWLRWQRLIRGKKVSNITIWGRRSSVNVQSVLWCLEELGLAYDRIDAGFTFGVVNTDEFRQMNPNGKVPVIVDGESVPIFEAGAIIRYLATQYGTAPFWPGPPAERAMVDKWAEWAKLNFASVFIPAVFWPLVRIAPSKRDYAAIDVALKSVEADLAIADAALAKTRYLAGNDFSLADIQLGYCLYRYYDIEVTRAGLPNLAAYYHRLQTRPAFAGQVMVSYDELRVSEG